ARDSHQPQNGCRSPRVHAAVLLHHLINPRKADRVENQTMEKPVERRRERPRTARGQHKHPHGNPREQRKIVVWERERESGAATESEQRPRVPAEIHSAPIQRLMIACLKPSRSSARLAASASASLE